MSHFTVMVIGDHPEDQLAKFDEQLEMPRYVKYTKQELIDKGKKEIEDYKNGFYADYLADPEAYKESSKTNPAHFKYVSEEFPKKLEWTDKEIHEEQLKWYEKEDIGKYGEVYSTSNPNGKWDWYMLGGRWENFFKVKGGGHADCLGKSLIDFQGMRREAEKKATKRYNNVAEATKGLPAITSWEEMRKNIKPIDKAREAYHAQPKVKAFNELDMGIFASIEEYEMPKEVYLQNARNRALSPFAMVINGEWVSKGEMHMFGMSTDEITQEEWDAKVNEILDGLPDDTLISLYDCHC